MVQSELYLGPARPARRPDQDDGQTSTTPSSSTATTTSTSSRRSSDIKPVNACASGCSTPALTRSAAFHIVGTIFDTVCKEGDVPAEARQPGPGRLTGPRPADHAGRLRRVHGGHAGHLHLRQPHHEGPLARRGRHPRGGRRRSGAGQADPCPPLSPISPNPEWARHAPRSARAGPTPLFPLRFSPLGFSRIVCIVTTCLHLAKALLAGRLARHGPPSWRWYAGRGSRSPCTRSPRS